jgi:hypothetical protein
MTQNSAVGVGVLVAAAAVVLLLGYRIRRGDVWLVAGYRPDRVRDPAALARTAGGAALGLGVVLLAAAAIALVRAL